MIVASKLVKRYGNQTAVDGVGFSVAQGETFGLLGPNGAGKTTTISMLVGLLEPDEGTVVIGDRFDPTTPAGRRLIGIAPQSLSLYDDLSALENLRFFARLYGLSGAELKNRVDWALEFAGLADRAKDRIATYSGGMKRRINLSVALLHEPKILLLDEPTVGVDPQSRNHLFERIESLAKQGVTIVYTTHYMEEAARLCDRVAIMDHGKILAIDTVAKLIAAHGGDSIVEAICDTPPTGRWAQLADAQGVVRVQSTEPLAEVAKMADEGLRFRSLQVSQPTLEHVFLNLTGRSLRDG